MLHNKKTIHRKGLPWKEMRETVSGYVDFVIRYVHFIYTIHHNPDDQKLLLTLKSLKNKIDNAIGPFLTYEETIEIQQIIFPTIINWNSNIRQQISDFDDLCITIARSYQRTESNYNPLKSLDKNNERFILASSLITRLQYNIDHKNITTIDILAMFYGLITTTETTYHYLFEAYRNIIKSYQLEKTFDIYNIFSIKSKLKNRRGEDQTDIQAVRNSLAHFNFKFEESKIVINLDVKNNSVRKITFDEFHAFYFNGIFLLQSMLAIIYWRSVIATLRENFVKKRKCPKCKKAKLDVAYTEEIMTTKKDPSLCTYWICDHCKINLPYKKGIKKRKYNKNKTSTKNTTIVVK